MTAPRPSSFFLSFRAYCTATLHLYFRKLQLHNVEAIPRTGPVIFVPNHQNAFLDAILIICNTPRLPWSIARASVFKKGFATRALTWLRIKPVFRMRDGWSSLRNNDAIFKDWIEMLARGEDIIIFAEGNHNEPYTTGSLQKGFARMALQFQQANDTPLTIVPVGMHYESHHSFRTRVLVNFGNPIAVNEIIGSSLNEREKLEELVAVTERELESLTLAIPFDETYQHKVDYLFKHRIHKKDMVQQLEADRKVIADYPLSTASSKPNRPAFLRYLNPVIWIGFLFNYPAYAGFRALIRKMVKDSQFIGSIKYALGTFLLPIYYAILLGIIYLVIPDLLVVAGAAIAIPVCGILAVDALRRR